MGKEIGPLGVVAVGDHVGRILGMGASRYRVVFISKGGLRLGRVDLLVRHGVVEPESLGEAGWQRALVEAARQWIAQRRGVNLADHGRVLAQWLDGIELRCRSEERQPWANLSVVVVGRAFRVGWDGTRFARSADAQLLADRHPRVVERVEDWLQSNGAVLLRRARKRGPLTRRVRCRE